jgi:hypothetical protein
LKKGNWKALEFKIPAMEGALIDEMGFCFHILGLQREMIDFVGLIDDLYADGKPDYSLELNKEREEVWTGLHREISQFTKLKGLMYLHDGQLNLSCADFAEAYTGRHDWTDYTATFYFTPITGEHHMVNVRVQGAIRSYAVGLYPDGRIALLKNDNGYSVLASEDFAWKAGTEYKVMIAVKNNYLLATINDTVKLEYTDSEHPYLTGSVGVSLLQGSHCKYSRIVVS